MQKATEGQQMSVNEHVNTERYRKTGVVQMEDGYKFKLKTVVKTFKASKSRENV